MKTKITFYLLILFCISFFSCSEKEITDPPFLTIEKKQVNLIAEQSEQIIPIKTNIANWSYSLSSDTDNWIEIIKQSSGLTLKAKRNENTEVRKATITVRAEKLSETITIQQMGQAPSILVSPTQQSIDANGGIVTIEIVANVPYDIIIPADTDWVKETIQDNTEAADTEETSTPQKQHIFEVAWHKTEKDRTANIIVKQKGGNFQQLFHISQKGQKNYDGTSSGSIKDDIKIPIHSASATSQQNGSGDIKNSYDGDYNTIYHSNWSNGGANYFPITLDYFFENQDMIEYFIYYPRQDNSNNGHFKEVEIWASTEEKPTLVKIMDYDFNGNNSPTKLTFEKPILNPKNIRFVIKSGNGDGQGFASCAEMEFYKSNPDNFPPLSIFTDITCSELKPEITMEQIEKIPNPLFKNIAFFLFNDKYPSEFRVQTYKAWPHPNDFSKRNKTSTYSLLDNPTGISIKANEELIVFVGNTGGQQISLKIQNLDKPGGDGYGNASYYPLTEGINKIIAKNQGLGYVLYHTPNYESAPPIKIHFATGTVNGYFDSQKHNASDWNRLLEQASDKYFDVVGKNAHLTFPTSAYRSYTRGKGLELINAYDNLVELEQDFMGLMKYNRPVVNRAYFHVMYHAYMYSTSYRTAYNESTIKHILDVETLKKSPWGPAHELGHTNQTRPGFKWHGMTEVTTNVHSLYVQTQWGNASRLETENMGRFNNRYEKAFFNSFVQNTPHPGEGDVFCKLVSLWQLQLYLAKAKGYTDFYKDFYELVRTSPDKSTPGEQQLEFTKLVCDVAKIDLTDFFKKWGYYTPFNKEIDDYGKRKLTITKEKADAKIAEIKAKNYPVAGSEVAYICDSNWEYYQNKANVVKGTATKNGKNIRMTGWANVIAYEVYENDKLVFVSNRANFNLENATTANTKIYAIAYNGSKTEVTF